MGKIRILITVSVILAGSWLGWKYFNGRSSAARNPLLGNPKATEMVPCSVWFPSKNGLDLCEEANTRPKTDDPGLRLKGVMEALHRGPTTPCSLHLFPEDSTFRAVFLSADGVAYLDYPKAVFERSMGLREEFLFIRALGKTLMRNCPEVRSFVLLVDGAPRDFISNHMPAHGKFILPATNQKK